MAKKNEDAFIGTHAKVILSDWPVIAALVAKHGKLIKEQSQTPSEEEKSVLPNVISRREVEDAINGPLQAFFKQKITAYSTISRIRLHLNMKEDDTLKEKRAKLSDEDKVPDSILKNTTSSDLTKILQELDQLTTEHEQQWEEHRQQWTQQILQRLNEQRLSLSEIEVKEFSDPEPISELLDRFVALNIDLPKTKKSDMNFSKYLTLKADITVQSALSRQHMPHGQPEIQKVLGKLKSDFNAIAKQETQILTDQKTAANQVVANISW